MRPALIPLPLTVGAAIASLRATIAPVLTPLTFHPDWFPSAQFAGIYVALDCGHYREGGLAMTIVPFAYV